MPRTIRSAVKMKARSAHGKHYGSKGPELRHRNPLLVQAKARIEGSVPERLKEMYLRMIADDITQWSKETRRYLNTFVAQSIIAPADVPAKVAQWICGGAEGQEETGQISIESPGYPALMCAVLYLTCDVLEYVEQKKRFPVDRRMLDQTTALVKNELAWRYGVIGSRIT